MRRLLRRFWHDDSGCVAADAWLVIAGVLVLGSAITLAALRVSLAAEAQAVPVQARE
jgi:hypothetical protein